MKAQHPKLTGCRKSSTKREVYRNTILWQETRKISNKQPNLKSETIRERRTKIKFKISRRKEIIKIRENKWNRDKENNHKINETKSWFFEKINKIDKPLVRLINKKRERTQISKIRNKKQRGYNWFHSNTKDYKRLLWTTVCQ